MICSLIAFKKLCIGMAASTLVFVVSSLSSTNLLSSEFYFLVKADDRLWSHNIDMDYLSSKYFSCQTQIKDKVYENYKNCQLYNLNDYETKYPIFPKHYRTQEKNKVKYYSEITKDNHYILKIYGKSIANSIDKIVLLSNNKSPFFNLSVSNFFGSQIVNPPGKALFGLSVSGLQNKNIVFDDLNNNKPYKCKIYPITVTKDCSIYQFTTQPSLQDKRLVKFPINSAMTKVDNPKEIKGNHFYVVYFDSYQIDYENNDKKWEIQTYIPSTKTNILLMDVLGVVEWDINKLIPNAIAMI